MGGLERQKANFHQGVLFLTGQEEMLVAAEMLRFERNPGLVTARLRSRSLG